MPQLHRVSSPTWNATHPRPQPAFFRALLAFCGMVLPAPFASSGQVVCPGSDAVVLDCNGNGTDDYCDIAAGTSADVNTNGIPDACDTTTCVTPWSGFEPAPPFAIGAMIHGLDTDADGSAWDNPNGTWSVTNQGCPSSQGKAIKGVAQAQPPDDVLSSEYFRSVDGRLDCGAAIQELAFDARYEASLNPRIDWQLTLRDALHESDVVLIHWASTQSSYPGVTNAQGGNGRGRILVKNPGGSPAFINTGFTLSLNTCHSLRVVLDNVNNTVELFINGTLRLTTDRLDAGASRIDAFRVRQAANGQGSGGLNRLGLDNFSLCITGGRNFIDDCNSDCRDDAASLADGSSSDCDSNGVPDECDGGCNANGLPDLCDIAAGTSLDCNSNGTPDECEPDCNENGVADGCDLSAGSSNDCDTNGVPDECQADCGADGVPDACDPDCDGDGSPDSCEVVWGTAEDCDANGTLDSCEIESGIHQDCNGNLRPDICELAPLGESETYRILRQDLINLTFECANTGLPFGCGYGAGQGFRWMDRSGAVASGLVIELMLGRNCHGPETRLTTSLNGFPATPFYTPPPECNCNTIGGAVVVLQIPGASYRPNAENVFRIVNTDTCLGFAPRAEWQEAYARVTVTRTIDCNSNGSLDDCDIAASFSWDCNSNGLPDECELPAGTSLDCNTNGVPDECEPGCNHNGIPDICEIAAGTSLDCNHNAIPDACDLASSASVDCQDTGIPDECELAAGTSADCNSSGVPDECEVAEGSAADCNRNGRPDSCDLNSQDSLDADSNGVPDECDPDCNTNGMPDRLDIAAGTSSDCDGQGVPDECQDADCNANGVVDACDMSMGYSPDCNRNRVPDECDLDFGLAKWIVPYLPEAVEGQAIVESASGRVMFGGLGDGGFSGRTWEGSVLRASTGPSPRAGHAMAYDRFRDRVVLFGGRGDDGLNGDTWEWDGVAWLLRSSDGPSPREAHALAFDEVRSVVVLFGGHDIQGRYLGDTWEWNGIEWTFQTNVGPSPRQEHAMSYHASYNDHKVVLFGGKTHAGLDGETWAWDGTNWTLRSTTGPSPRYGHAMAPAHQSPYDETPLILFGGSDDAGLNREVWFWHGTLWVRHYLEGPTARRGHAMLSSWGGVEMLGGIDEQGPNREAWIFSIIDVYYGWTMQRIPGPAPVGGHGLTYDHTRRSVVMFGGSDYGSNGFTWEWNGLRWQSYGGTGPAGRRSHAMAYDTFGGVCILFGGQGQARLGDTWERSGTVWTQRSPALSPTPRYGHALAYDSARRVTVLFGGYDGALNGETWEWDGANWAPRPTAGPSPRVSHAMAYDAAREVTVLFGGYDGAYRADTWEWDGVEWLLRSDTGPAPQWRPSLNYDPGRGVTRHHGRSSDGRGELWEWDGAAWALRASNHTVPVVGPVAYDVVRGRSVYFEYGPECPYQHPCELGVTWEFGPASADCNGNGIPDGCTEIELDCNHNGMPDGCEAIAPCPSIVGASSWRLHGGGVGRDAISLNPSGRVDVGGITSEPRLGGLVELRLTFDTPPVGTGAEAPMIEQRVCGDAGNYSAYSGASDVATEIEGHELVLTFTPALENARTYRLTLGPEVTASADRSIEVRVLSGDVDSDGLTRATDRSTVVGVWTGSGYSPATDLDLSGRTNAGDRSLAVSAWIGLENCAP